MSTLRHVARGEFEQATPGAATFDEIKVGALQRIADATELMAKNHAQLVADAERWKRRAELAEQREESLGRSLIAQRGQVTRLRNQLAARAATTPEPTPEAMDAARLDALSRPGWELSHPDDPEIDAAQLWQVHRCNGSRNDREWTLIGAGATPREAIDAAMAKDATLSQGGGL